MKQIMIEHILEIENIIKDMKEKDFSDNRLDQLINQYKLLIEYSMKAESIESANYISQEATKKLSGEALYLFGKFLMIDEDDTLNFKKREMLANAIKELKRIKIGVYKIQNTINYLRFHIEELNIRVNKLEESINKNKITNYNLFELLDIIDRFNILISIYDGIYHEICELDKYSYELKPIKDIELIKISQKIIKLEKQIKNTSILEHQLRENNSFDLETYNKVNHNNDITLIRRPNTFYFKNKLKK